MCEAGALIDLRRRTLLLFAAEGPITRLRHRAATWEALAAAWPGWELRWTYDGPAELREYLGLDPEDVRRHSGAPYPEFAMERDDEELSDPGGQQQEQPGVGVGGRSAGQCVVGRCGQLGP
ncbi:hypothetical protein [Streptomyces tritici]|uniref:hypothetical protein n=1 Tax=Streptomyces tritici TaxID=2054410 RepID=UPI003AEF41E4